MRKTVEVPAELRHRVFEALACGVPLISAPWDDVEGLFRPGRDFAVAASGAEMERLMRAVLADPELGEALAQSGLATVRERHTCAHRVDELLAIHAEIRGGLSAARQGSASSALAMRG